MAFSFGKFLKGLNIKEENTLTPKEIDIVPGGTAGTKTTLTTSQTGNITVTLPATTSTLISTSSPDVITNKSIDADTNTLTNIDNNEIKALAGIDATKIADGSVTNAEFQYINGLTSDAQTQINSKQASGSYITALTSDVTAAGPGSVAATVAFVGGSSAANVNTATTLVNTSQSGNKILMSPSGGGAGAPAFRALEAADVPTLNQNTTGSAATATTAGNVTGTVAIANGGTGQVTAGPAFDALAPTTTKADLITRNATVNTRLGVGSDGQVLVADSAQSTGLKWDNVSGIKNYVLNPGADSSTSGWATYADVAGALPVDGTGGAPTLTLTRTTSSPLAGAGSFLITKDAANRQGEGASYDFTIDRADQGKVLSVSFDYEIASGTFATSDLTVYFYDVTNAVVIQPAGYSIQNAGVQTKQIATFQTAIDSTSYRLIIHTASTSALAYTLKFDNVIVSPQSIVNGTPVTDWQDYTLTIGATTTPPTLGTTTINKAQWRRVGSDMEIAYDVRQTVAGTAGSGSYLFPIPSGYTIDSTKIPGIYTGSNYIPIGVGQLGDGGLFVVPVPYDYTRIILQIDDGLMNTVVDSSTWALSTADRRLSFKVAIPITGWSSNVQMSSDTDTRVVTANVAGDAASATSGNPILFPTTIYDTHGMYNPSNGRFTAPVPGYYKLYGRTSGGTGGLTLFVYKNGINYDSLVGLIDFATGNGKSVFSTSIQLSANDYVDIRPNATYDVDSANITFERISGPSIIAASESINARYSISGSVASSTAQPIDYSVKEFDTHNAVTTGSSWKFTAPISGKYKIIVNGASATSSTNVAVYKGGVLNSYLEDQIYTSFSSGSTIISMLASEYIDIRYQTSLNTGAVTTGNYICIERLGN
jgi:C1q domain